jgi:hypothetical protein
MQGWSGMLGLLEIGSADSPGSPSFELASQGVTREAPFVLWEWAVQETRRFPEGSNTFFQGNFVAMDNLNPLTLFPVNDEIQPAWALTVGEVMHLKFVQGQTTTGTALYMYDDMGKQVDFWVFAADGISFDKPYRKTLLVLGVGQRQGILVQFDAPGTYRVMQGVLNDFQGDGAGVGPDYPNGPDEPIAFFHVTEEAATVATGGVGIGAASSPLVGGGGWPGNKRKQQQRMRGGGVAAAAAAAATTGARRSSASSSSSPPPPFSSSTVDVDSLVFTPGIPSSQAIKNEEVEQQLTVTFQVLSSLSKLPVPQFVVDGEPFDYRNISATFQRGTSAEWTVSSAMNYFHPIHIHVNPFQVMNMTTGFLPGTKLQEAAMSTSLEPRGQWRDTALVLPFGETVLRQRYGGGPSAAGKTVFHCHYLDHEDQGMMKAMMIKKQ